jgi:hypothetical protein
MPSRVCTKSFNAIVAARRPKEKTAGGRGLMTVGWEGNHHEAQRKIAGPSEICQLKRAAGCGIIAPRRSNSAHLHRPWRASVDETDNYISAGAL